jgi:hypothetical protein
MDQETGNFAAHVDAYFARRFQQATQRPRQLEIPWLEVSEIWPGRSVYGDSPNLRFYDAHAKGEDQANICAGLCNTPQRTSDLRLKA